MRKEAAGFGLSLVLMLAYTASTHSLLHISLGLLLAYGIYRYYEFVSHYPKGPFPLPFIGNASVLDAKSIHKSFDRIGKTQPGIYTLFMPLPFVQITDYDILREAFVEKGDDFTGRPQNKIIQDIFSFAPNSGVIGSAMYGVSRDVQRFPILRDFGMGKNVMEERVMVSNVINDVLFGFRFPYDDCQPLMDYVLRFKLMMNNVMENMGFALGMAFPFRRDVPFLNWFIVGRTKQRMQELNQYIVDSVGRVLHDYNVEDEPNDVNLMSTCADFFLVGQETTTTTLLWAMILLAKHSDVQDKLRQEILSVVGSERFPTMADQIKMPYARACALELQRYANVLATNVQRVTERDVVIRGQTIPAGTWVNGDIHYLMANDLVFENPQEFRPERYLTEDGTILKKDLLERTLPFSLGKRVCAGESVARVEIFLGLTATIQSNRILPIEGRDIDLEPVMAATFLQPKQQRLRLEKVV